MVTLMVRVTLRMRQMTRGTRAWTVARTIAIGNGAGGTALVRREIHANAPPDEVARLSPTVVALSPHPAALPRRTAGVLLPTGAPLPTGAHLLGGTRTIGVTLTTGGTTGESTLAPYRNLMKPHAPR